MGKPRAGARVMRIRGKREKEKREREREREAKRYKKGIHFLDLGNKYSNSSDL